MPPPVQLGLVPISKPTIGKNNYQGFNPRSEVLSAGWNGYDSRPLPSDILVEHDVGIKVRDGCTLYADIYRPPTSGANEKVPAILAWSPFGKKFNGLSMLKMLPWGVGIPEGTLSGLERFEGPDPAEYVPQGYAIVNVDARGSGNSDGSVVIMGTQEAEDGYDVIEEIARMDWCSGSVGLAGNSHLGIVQWFIASLRPPSLKAIAPWEAAGDLYREQFVRGGVWDSGLFDFITEHIIQGHNGLESFAEMYRRSPLQNAYWADKRAEIKNINIPTYVVASYSTFVHTQGSIRGWLDVDTPQKWLRWDPYQEWFDLWAVKESRDELAAFFDKFLKGKDNGFEKVPRVRMALLQYGNKDAIYPIVEDDYPIPRTKYTSYYLGPNNTLSLSPTQSGKASYFSELSKDGFESVQFTYTFSEKTTLAGLPKAVLYMSTPDADDMNIYVLLRKLDKNGNPMLNLNIPWKNAPINSFDELEDKDKHNLLFYFGPLGILKASHRQIDESKSMHPQYPFHPHDSEQKLQPNEVVELQIGLWAMGVAYEAGESISLQISGQYPLFKNYTEEEKRNPRGEKGSVGTHVVHFGEYQSRIVLPVV
ncbi:alpha/beta-hydrolase [Aspergillus unguis]